MTETARSHRRGTTLRRLAPAWLCHTVYAETRFFASAPQLIGTTLVVAGLVAAAFLVRGAAVAPGRGAGAAPGPWLAGASALVASSLFMLTEMLPGWVRVAACLLLVVAFSVAVRRWSRRTGWGPVHRLALAGGAVATYAWLGIVMEPESGPRTGLDHIGSGIIAGTAIGLLALAAWRLTSWNRRRVPTPATKTIFDQD
jgi:hypothetical protein